MEKTMGKFTRLKSILYKALSVIVILINLTLVTFVWVIQNDVSSAAVAIFEEVDNIAQVMRNGIARVEPKVSNLRRLIGQVEIVSEVIAENVSDNGIISRLLPQTFVDNLRSSSQSLFENFNAVYDLLGTTSDILLTLEKIPFVAIPERGLSTISTLQVTMEDIAVQVDTVQSSIEDVREETSARISQVTAAANFLGAEIEKAHTNLLQIDSDLDAIQISVRKYQRLTPPIVISSVILFSLLSGWVIYSQVVMFSRSGRLNNQTINIVSEHQEPLLDEGMDD
jgi:hypothetical protein